MNLDTDAQRHLRALLRLIGENPVDVKTVTFNLDKATANVTKKKGSGVADTSQKTGEWVYTEKPGVSVEDGTGV
jgi:hypothetical protein